MADPVQDLALRTCASSMNSYQELAVLTAIFPDRGEINGISYCTLGLNGEAGEVAELVKKALRDDGGTISPQRRDAIMLELGDCLWYVANLADQLELNLSEIAKGNLEKLGRRKAEGKLQGSGSDR